MQVYKDSSRAVLAIVSKSGSLYFNHVHLFCLLLSQVHAPFCSDNFSIQHPTSVLKNIDRSSSQQRGSH